VDSLKAALAKERKDREAVQRELDKIKRDGMTEQERAVAEAKAAGKAEAVAEAGKAVAAATFRELATGKLADPGKALDLVDLGKFVSDDGTVDRTALGKAVDSLAAQVPGPPGRVPPGPRGEPAGEPDFIRDRIRSGR
jgi:hypothetical protein